MKPFLACLVALSACPLIAAPVEPGADSEIKALLEKMTPRAPRTDGRNVTVTTPSFAWTVRFWGDGSVQAQYGALHDDSAELPAGTVDYDALVKALARLKTDQKNKNAQAAIRNTGETSVTAFFLRDDTLIRYLVDSFDERWESEGPRFRKLLANHPMFPEEK